MRLFLKALLSLLACTIAACGTSGPLPGATPSASPTPAAPTSSSNVDIEWLRLTAPPGWNRVSTNHYQGADGYAWLELRDSAGARLATACMLEANREKPNTYGAAPEIRDMTLDGQPACLILPSADQPAARHQESLYLLLAPDSARPNTLLALHADRAHIEEIVQGLAFSQPQPTPAPNACDFSVAGSASTITRMAGIRVDEFPIARSTTASGATVPGATASGATCSPIHDPQGFDQRVQSGPPAARAAEVRSQQYQAERLARVNARLAPFGFEVQTYGQQLFRVLRGGKTIRSNLSWLGQVSVRADGKDFIFPVVDSYNANAYLVRPDGVHMNDNPDLLAFDLVFPVYAGSDRINMEYDTQTIARPAGSPALLQIKKNDQLIDTLSVSGATPASGPVRGLWSWNGHWYLVLPGLVLENGAGLNQRLGYPEIFSWRLLKDKPFYFYRKDAQMHAVYNDQPLPALYDEILSEPQWTDAILVQMRTYESGMVFYARRGDTWYYVVLSAE
jgi:hypothetical protein